MESGWTFGIPGMESGWIFSIPGQVHIVYGKSVDIYIYIYIYIYFKIKDASLSSIGLCEDCKHFALQKDKNRFTMITRELTVVKSNIITVATR